MLDPINAWGENTSTFSEAILSFASNLCEPRIPVSLERGVSTSPIHLNDSRGLMTGLLFTFPGLAGVAEQKKQKTGIIN